MEQLQIKNYINDFKNSLQNRIDEWQYNLDLAQKLATTFTEEELEKSQIEFSVRGKRNTMNTYLISDMNQYNVEMLCMNFRKVMYYYDSNDYSQKLNGKNIYEVKEKINNTSNDEWNDYLLRKFDYDLKLMGANYKSVENFKNKLIFKVSVYGNDLKDIEREGKKQVVERLKYIFDIYNIELNYEIKPYKNSNVHITLDEFGANFIKQVLKNLNNKIKES